MFPTGHNFPGSVGLETLISRRETTLSARNMERVPLNQNLCNHLVIWGPHILGNHWAKKGAAILAGIIKGSLCPSTTGQAGVGVELWAAPGYFHAQCNYDLTILASTAMVTRDSDSSRMKGRVTLPGNNQYQCHLAKGEG